MYEVEKTSNYRGQYNRLQTRIRRIVDEAIEIIKEHPREYLGKITHISNTKYGGLYRYRVPGCYILYILPQHKNDEEQPNIILTGVKALR